MLDFITNEHRMISASVEALCSDLRRSDRDAELRLHERVSFDIVKQGFSSLGLFDELDANAPIGSSLVQCLISFEAGRANLPFPLLEMLSAAFLITHSDQRALAANAITDVMCSQSSLAFEGAGQSITLSGHISGTVNAVPFADICQKIMVELSSTSGSISGERGLIFADSASCERKVCRSVEPDYPVYDIQLIERDIPDTMIIRKFGDGRDAAETLGLQNALLAAAEIAGACSYLIELTKDHLLSRAQFGKPLGSNQILKHRMAENYVKTQALTMMVNYAAASLDADDDGAKAAAYAAKNFAGNIGKKLAEDMLQMHGAIGYTTEYPLHRYMRRILRLTTSYGSTYHQGEMLYRDFSRSQDNN